MSSLKTKVSKVQTKGRPDKAESFVVTHSFANRLAILRDW